jgi:hypothetical protein
MQGRLKRNCTPEQEAYVAAAAGTPEEQTPAGARDESIASDERTAVFESALLRTVERGKRHLIERLSSRRHAPGKAADDVSARNVKSEGAGEG